MADDQVPIDSKYLPELMAEKDSIDPSFVHALRLISNEIDKIKNPQNNKENSNNTKETEMFNLHEQKFPKASCCIKVPTDVYPQVNFVGRLIGPGGSTLKGIQDVTSTRIGILGKGSMRDRKKADDLLKGGEAKYSHLNLPLHVRISGMGPLDQVYMNIGRAINEISKLLHVDEEELAAADAGRGRGRGGPRGSFRGRGGRGGAAMRGAPAGRGVSARGGARGGVRGGATGRGGSQSRGRGGAGRGGYAKAQSDPYATAQVESYGYEGYGAESYEGYGAEYADANSYDAYGTEAYAADPYATEGAYGADASYGADAYAYGDTSYDAYGNGSADLSGAGQYGASKPFRGKMRGGGRGRGSAKPY